MSQVDGASKGRVELRAESWLGDRLLPSLE